MCRKISRKGLFPGRTPERSVAQGRATLIVPFLFVRKRLAIKVTRLGGRVVDPLAQQWGPVDHVDGELVEFIFVGEVAPEIVIRIQIADRLERQRLEPPRPECLMIVKWAFGVNEEAVVENT